MDIRAFLQESPIAARLRLPVRAVVGRGAHSLSEVRSIAEAGTYTPATGAGGARGAASGADGSGHIGFGARGGEAAELEASGVVLARGRVVRKGGKLFFKVDALGAADGEAVR